MDSFEDYITTRTELKKITQEKGYYDLPFELLDEAETFYNRILRKQPNKKTLERYIAQIEPKGFIDSFCFRLNSIRRAHYSAAIKALGENYE